MLGGRAARNSALISVTSLPDAAVKLFEEDDPTTAAVAPEAACCSLKVLCLCSLSCSAMTSLRMDSGRAAKKEGSTPSGISGSVVGTAVVESK